MHSIKEGEKTWSAAHSYQVFCLDLLPYLIDCFPDLLTFLNFCGIKVFCSATSSVCFIFKIHYRWLTKPAMQTALQNVMMSWMDHADVDVDAI